MTPPEFKRARNRLGLSILELAEILNVDERTVRRWEQDETDESARPPNPIACRVLMWLLAGFRPPEWPS